jgi:hypothetical protein
MTRKLPKDLKTGNQAIDSYLDNGFYGVNGMSSRFATAISAFLLLHQTKLGIKGDFIEIGAFQGRYLIAQSLALQPDEKALGIDTFNWPNDQCEAIFLSNCAKFNAPVIALKANTADLTPADFAHYKPRFIHIDGDHSPEPLKHDLALAVSMLHKDGLICLDDMLHPCYPFLVGVVETFLKNHPDFRLMAIIDREDIVAAAKFLLCRVDSIPLYETMLMAHYKKRHFILGGDALGHHCVVLTPFPRLAIVE